MPELTPAQRGAGPELAAGAARSTDDRLYGLEDGGRCDRCGMVMVAAAGGTRHPTCEPWWPRLVTASRKARARRRMESDNG